MILKACILIDNSHPFSITDEFSSMAGGDKFTEIDLTKVKMRTENTHLLTLNTHLGTLSN